MNNEKLGQEPAFPLGAGGYIPEFGMSKRFYAASMALQGLLSNPNTVGQIKEEAGPVSAKITYANTPKTAYITQ